MDLHLEKSLSNWHIIPPKISQHLEVSKGARKGIFEVLPKVGQLEGLESVEINP